MSLPVAHRDAVLLAVLVVAVTALYFILSQAAGLELHYDEAQYWEWAQQLDWSYYSKGPLISWLIAASTALFGHGEWQVRIFGWMIHGLFLATLFGFARDVTGSRECAWWAVLLAFTTPLYFVVGVVMTTDNLQLLFWTLGLWSIYRALFLDRPRAWYGAGLAVGIGALGKLSIGLLPAFAGIALLLNKNLRAHLRNPHLWGGVALMLLCITPMLYWNAQHGWVMFRHELERVEWTTNRWAGAPGSNRFGRAVEFVTSQIGALSPLMVALAVWVLRKRPTVSGHRFLWMLSIAWLGFFFFKSFGNKIQLNWAAMCYVGWIVLLAGAIPTFSRAQRNLMIAALCMSVAVVAVVLFPGLAGLQPSQFTPIKKLKGWREPIARVAEQAGPVDFIFTEEYTTAAEVAFYWPARIPVYVMGSKDRRFNQHDLWPSVEREAGKTAVVVQSNIEALPQIALTAFDQCVKLNPVEARDSAGVLRTFYAYRCVNYRHIVWPKSNWY